jgi:uncharacterized SAM-binding protein YcdF (DUF218 family)
MPSGFYLGAQVISLLLDKILPLFVYPVGLTILACIAALGFSILGFARTSRTILAAAIGLLWIAATPLFANWIYAGLESRYPPVAVEVHSRADVAIVLGGAVGRAQPPRLTGEANDAVDRLFHAARLFRAGKVDTLLVSGGNQPWLPAAQSEAELIADLLVELGVSRQAIVLESESRNTRENAVNSARLIKANGWQSVFLVTSGAHMPRALAAFQRAGIEARPAASDIRATFPLYENILDILPDANALVRTSDALKEYLGLIVYRLRGWT